MNPFSVLTSKIFAGLSVVLLLCVIVQTVRLNVTHGKLEKCELGRAADRNAFKAAAAQAEAKALAQKQAVEASYRAKAEETDNDYQAALARAQRASDAYAQRMRAKVVGGASGGTAAPAPSDRPQGPDRSGADAVLVGRDDFDILIENSVRLEAAHQWAKTLSVDPLPDPAFGAK